MDSTYRVNSPPLTHQTIDGEVVLVNLVTGFYYSLRGTAAVLWGWLEAGHSRARMVAHLARCCRVAPTTVEPFIDTWLQELQSEGIVDAVAVPATTVASEPIALAFTFAPPVLEKFTDMRELLLLDPIHEVTELGWPHAKEAA